MPTVLLAIMAAVRSPRRAFLMIGMSARSGVDEEVGRGAGGADLEAALPKTLASRFIDNEFEEEVGNMGLAAAAGCPLLLAACPPSLRARRSAKDRFMPGKTERFFERVTFGAIALTKSAATPDHACGVSVWGKSRR